MGKGKKVNTPNALWVNLENYGRDLLDWIQWWQDWDLMFRR